MTARQCRHQYAELLRRFIAGRITNFDYESQFDTLSENLASSDSTVNEIFDVVWFSYCDIRNHTMAGDYALAGEFRQTVLRCILFLHSDCVYEWPTATVRDALLRLFTLGLHDRLMTAENVEGAGDEGVWPFFRDDDYRYALSHPWLLHGHGN